MVYTQRLKRKHWCYKIVDLLDFLFFLLYSLLVSLSEYDKWLLFFLVYMIWALTSFISSTIFFCRVAACDGQTPWPYTNAHIQLASHRECARTAMTMTNKRLDLKQKKGKEWIEEMIRFDAIGVYVLVYMYV